MTHWTRDDLPHIDLILANYQMQSMFWPVVNTALDEVVTHLEGRFLRKPMFSEGGGLSGRYPDWMLRDASEASYYAQGQRRRADRLEKELKEAREVKRKLQLKVDTYKDSLTSTEKLLAERNKECSELRQQVRDLRDQLAQPLNLHEESVYEFPHGSDEGYTITSETDVDALAEERGWPLKRRWVTDWEYIKRDQLKTEPAEDADTPETVSISRMYVTREGDPWSSWIEPALDQSWGDYTKLSWKLGTIYAETGLDITLTRFSTNWCVTAPGISFGSIKPGPGEFTQLWDTLTNFVAGYSLGKTHAENGTTEKVRSWGGKTAYSVDEVRRMIGKMR